MSRKYTKIALESINDELSRTLQDECGLMQKLRRHADQVNVRQVNDGRNLIYEGLRQTEDGRFVEFCKVSTVPAQGRIRFVAADDWFLLPLLAMVDPTLHPGREEKPITDIEAAA